MNETKNIQKPTKKAWSIAFVMPRFIVLGGETFKFKWLKRWGFYRILWFGLIAKFGWITVNKEAVDGKYISYGTATPIQELWDKDYRVRLIGKIFGEPILEYSNEA